MGDATTTISVRGEARQVVPPDFVTVSVNVQVRDADKAAALERARRAQAAAVAVLRELGGVPLTVDTVDAPLTWSTRTFSAHEDREYDERKGPGEFFWRAHVPIAVGIRNLDELPAISRALAAVAELEISFVEWGVDPRNPAWPVVRAAAISDAIAKARDYATALGGSVTTLVHVADEGLLGGNEHGGHRATLAMASLAGREMYDGSGAPDLDPVPQEISAGIEARFEATVAAL